LQEKTKGNLTPDEAKLVDDLLYELRMRYVQAEQGERRIITP
jgi:polyhydroxyalkanoate synthesis regulator phasin